MLTLPILTSLSSRKSKSRKSPSSFSSFGPEGNAESGTGGEEGCPLMDSAIRRSARPPQSDLVGSVIRSGMGKWKLAQSISFSSIEAA
jgi:hypothetical protein